MIDYKGLGQNKSIKSYIDTKKYAQKSRTVVNILYQDKSTQALPDTIVDALGNTDCGCMHEKSSTQRLSHDVGMTDGHMTYAVKRCSNRGDT